MRRRQFLAATAAGFACTAATSPARALSLQEAPAHLRLGPPVVDGTLDWSQLARAGASMFRDGRISRFPADLHALDGQEVALAGYMMPFTDADRHSEFMFGALQFHCPGCMMGELNRMMAVKAAEPVADADGPLVIRGRLRLLEDEASPLFYRLEAATEA
ncbi:hypothetical protein FNB15_08395 [Ferrovibrio terrae]|uniref:DUF3299 domain-containing protein n=1 Tax=Ferrovibrio terrae TaxID=2594003 RepID=A0A516H0I8_9PROT|nr:hypothetical protein [Ferrovibrio terrae]QDO97286.1 hypothetical protein FNB15_08395 [Ferrovibrio terrae]